MKKIKVIWKDIIIETPSFYKLNIVKKILKKLQKQHNFIINPEFLSKIKIANTPQGCIGIFYHISKTIKINPKVNWSSKTFYHWFHTVFIHEYIHAIDFANNFTISKTFFDYYLKSLKLVYKETENRDFKIKLDKNVNYLKYDRFYNVRPLNHSADGELDPILNKEGYGYDYCLTNALEFAAVTMELYFANPSRLSEELIEVCATVRNKYFYK